MKTADFHYDLPPELIAQQPADRRDGSRLLVLDRKTGTVSHRQFPDLLEYLNPGDVLVLNNSRVIPARLHGVNRQTGGQFELLLLDETAPNQWWALLRPGKRARLGTQIQLRDRGGQLTQITGTVCAVNEEGHRQLEFTGTPDLHAELDALGELPLPPYIARETELPTDRDRYQTVYARTAGSVAAPTAGLHFTAELIHKIRAKGAVVSEVTLHVGAGTFLPVKVDDPAQHRMHTEQFEINAEAAAAIRTARESGRRVIAVGTTSVRTLESAARENAGIVNFCRGKTDIFLYPPARFAVVDALLTNFHLPESTLLMLVSAFAAPGETWAGRDLILRAYTEAIRERYRFFSYGDAMLIL